MIRAVFFDLYNTLVHFSPTVEEIQVKACREVGICVTPRGVLQGYRLADDYFNRENSRSSLSQRSAECRDGFFSHYEQLILKGAGLDVSLALSKRIWELTTRVPKGFATFDDVVASLQSLKVMGLSLGLLSNLHHDIEALSVGLGFGIYLDFSITSHEVGAEKPSPAMFMAALSKVGVNANEAIHVGDQIYSDVGGARSVGIIPILLDRDNCHKDSAEYYRIRSLAEVKGVVTALL